jgi:calcineurin-like phosphoesterase family protein
MRPKVDFKKTLINWKKEYILFHRPPLGRTVLFAIKPIFTGHVLNGDGKPGYMEQFGQLGKRAVNVGVDVQGFHPVSIEEITKLTDG